MKTDDLLPIETLRTLIRLDEATGRLYWLPRLIESFSYLPEKARLRQCNRWQTLFAGKEALTATEKGYRRGIVQGRLCYAHHVVWALAHGRWPDAIDHDNRDRGDNRPSNLIERTQAENSKNQPVRVNSTSGVLGVNFNKRQQQWVARIQADDRRICLGSFATFDEAVAARREAERKYGYHPNHGT